MNLRIKAKVLFYFIKYRLHQEVEENEIETAKTSSSSEEWSLTETSTLLFYMDHMCMPRSSFLASLEQSVPDLFEELKYARHLLGVNITDSAHDPFQREKLIPFLKNVTHSISSFNHCK
jgi:hypothetical protein